MDQETPRTTDNTKNPVETQANKETKSNFAFLLASTKTHTKSGMYTITKPGTYWIAEDDVISFAPSNASTEQQNAE